MERAAGNPEQRGRIPVPCDTDQGCPKGHWSAPRSLSPKNRQAFNHFRAMAASRVTVTDPLAVKNGLTIQRALDRISELHREQALAATGNLRRALSHG